MSLFEIFVSNLRQTNLVRYQILIWVYGFYYGRSFRRFYKDLFRFVEYFKGEALIEDKSIKDQVLKRTPPIFSNAIRDLSLSQTSPEVWLSDLNLYGKYGRLIARILIVYQIFSTLYMSYILLRAFAPWSVILVKLDLDLALPHHCYLPGRIAIFPETGKVVSPMIAFMHLAWRFWQFFLTRYKSNDLFIFLNQDDKSIEQIYAKFSGTSAITEKEFSNDAKTRYIECLMLYPVPHKTHATFKLRPNRTRLSRKALDTFSATHSAINCLIGCFLLIAIGGLTFIFIFSDLGYTTRYPGCSPALEVELAEKRLTYTSFMSHFFGHRLVSFVVDGMENLVLWLDTCFALQNLFSLAYLIDFDLLICWKYMHERLIDLHRVLTVEDGDGNTSRIHADVGRQNGYPHDSKMYTQATLDIISEHSLLVKRKQSLLSSQSGIGPPNGPNHKSRSDRSRSVVRDSLFVKDWSHKGGVDVEEMVLETQSIIRDFFDQFESADVMVSDLLTCVVSGWLFSNFVLSFYSFNYSLDPSALIIVLFGFFFVTFYTIEILSIHRRSVMSYELLCSIMAHDKTRYKRKFISILEFYHGRNRSSFTLYRQNHPYITTTYITIIGWSMSILTILKNFLT